MKLWIDNVKPAPEGYVWCKSVNEAKDRIVYQEKLFDSACASGRYHFLNDNFQFVADYLEESRKAKIDCIDIGHDAVEHDSNGGDCIELLDWLEETGRNYPIGFHSMNAADIELMRWIMRSKYRSFVVVVNKEGLAHVRHVVEVEDYDRDEFIEWYYGIFHKLDGDEFIFCPTCKERDELIRELELE